MIDDRTLLWILFGLHIVEITVIMVISNSMDRRDLFFAEKLNEVSNIITNTKRNEAKAVAEMLVDKWLKEGQR